MLLHGLVIPVFFHQAARDTRKGNSQYTLNKEKQVSPTLSQTGRSNFSQTELCMSIRRWDLQQEVNAFLPLQTWMGCKISDLDSWLSGYIQTVLHCHLMFILFLFEQDTLCISFFWMFGVSWRIAPSTPNWLEPSSARITGNTCVGWWGM